MIKKIIAIILIAALNLQAVNLNNYITTYKSSAGSWTSPTTGMKYHYGGSYEFTFKGGNKFQPWITVAEPELEIGCNGVSLKGGFVGLLGLNEIKEQIKDAGQSLAWGAMLSLQYATPGLFEVFGKIREWATTIQRMMQNACNIGKALAASTPFVNHVNNKVDNFINNSPIATSIDNNFKGFSEFMKTIDRLTDCTGLSTTLDPATGKSPYMKCVEGNGASTTAANAPKQTTPKVATSQLLNKYIAPSAKPENKVYIDKLSNFLSTGKISTRSVVSSSAERTEISNTIKILRVFFGDIGLDMDSYKSIILDDTQAYNTPSTTGSYTYDLNRIREKMKKAKAGNNVPIPDPSYKMISPVISNAESAAKALIHGISANTNDISCGSGYCYINDATVYYSDFGDNNVRMSQVGIVSNDSASTNSNLRLEWQGSYNESIKSIRTMIRAKSGVLPSHKTIYDGSGAIASSSYSSNIPLLVPNMDRHIGTIVKIEKLAKKETALSAHLKTVLAEQNSILLAKSLFSIIEGKVIDSGMLGGTTEEITLFKKHISDIKNEVMKEIEKIDVTSQNLNEVNTLFKQIDQDLQDNKVKDF